jgi:uncharacterized protein (TIGR03118 family)
MICLTKSRLASIVRAQNARALFGGQHMWELKTMIKARGLLAAVLFGTATAVLAGPIGTFAETTLVSSATDPDLVNPWGMSSSAISPFWISDNGTGKVTLYNSLGVKQGLVVSMPAGSEQLTGQVFNGTASFHSDSFLFATESGTITGWRGALGTTAEELFTVNGASYKGLAIANDKSKIYAANFAAGTIDIFNSAGLVTQVSDPSLPAGYAPFNIQNIGGKLYVTYALRNGTDTAAGAGHGFVSVFDATTNTFTRLISHGALDTPWGLALAPVGFGDLGGELLVGNFGDGLINAFDADTGAFLGTLADASHTPLTNDGLWGLGFGNGGNGGSRASLYVTAGPNGETGGVFSRIDAIATSDVPEPASAALALLALTLLGVRGRRRTA